MAKAQFAASEDLKVVLFPFFDKVNNVYVTGGSDSLTVTVKRPNGTLLPSVPAAVYDSDTDFWTVTIPDTDYMQGDWLVKAVSDASDTLPQYRILIWPIILIQQRMKHTPCQALPVPILMTI